MHEISFSSQIEMISYVDRNPLINVLRRVYIVKLYLTLFCFKCVLLFSTHPTNTIMVNQNVLIIVTNCTNATKVDSQIKDVD